ncbi:MAG: MFS transporter [Hyphomicrobiaceae bacterium]|nr:MFS transporter [Hyphomicrobiaceae bacterium]
MTSAHTEIPRDPLGTQTRIRLVFFFHALAGAAFITRIADLQLSLGLSEAQLGLAFIGQPLGAVTMNLFSSRLIERFGTRRALMFGMVTMSALQLVMAFTQNGWQLFAILALFAASFALTNVTINVEADRVEALTGQKLMSSCHGIWAFGYLLATLVAVWARGKAISVPVHFGAFLIITILAVALVVSPMHPLPPRAHGGSGDRKPFFALPTPTILLLVLFGISGTLAEMSTRVWSVIYMRDSFTAPDWVDSLALTTFALLIAVARMVADRLLARTSDVLGLRILLATAITGVFLVALAPHYLVALAGFALMGIGVCVSFPKMLSAAAQIGDRPSSENVASTTLSNTMVMLVAPGLFGLVAEATTISVAFLLLIPMLAISILVAPVIDRHHGKKGDQPPSAS